MAEALKPDIEKIETDEERTERLIAKERRQQRPKKIGKSGEHPLDPSISREYRRKREKSGIQPFLPDDSHLFTDAPDNDCDTIASAVAEQASSALAAAESDSEHTDAKESSPQVIDRSGNGGNDGGGPPENPGSGEFELLQISPDVEDAVVELKNRGLDLELTPLVNDFKEKGRTRRDILSRTRIIGLRTIQKESKKLKELARKAEDLKYTSSLCEAIYTIEAAVYRSWGESPENFRRLLGFDRPLDLVWREGSDGIYIPRKWADLGGGNCNILRMINAEYDLTRPLIDQALSAQARGKSRRNGASWANEFVDAANQVVRHKQSRRNTALTGFDISPAMTDQMLQKNINAATTDLCLPAKDFIQQVIDQDPDFRFNDTDVIHSKLTFDRLSNIVRFLENVPYLGKLDPNDPSDVIIGTILPLSNVGDSETRAPNVPEFHFWNPEAQGGDPRKSMMGDRTSSIVNMAWLLNSYGFPVVRIGEHPSHEVLNLHSINEPAKIIREEYSELKDKQYVDPELQDLVARAFAEPGDPRRYPDDHMVCIPQEYKIVYFVCRMTKPKDASEILAEL